MLHLDKIIKVRARDYFMLVKVAPDPSHAELFGAWIMGLVITSLYIYYIYSSFIVNK